MKGLNKIPSLKMLMHVYNELQSNSNFPVKKIVLWSQWTRFDPRLGEILIEYLKLNWKRMNPVELHYENLKSPWPQALGVLLEHIKSLELTDSHLFSIFSDLVTYSVEPIEYQAFAIGLYKPGGAELWERAVRPHPFFSKWGFFEAIPMLSKMTTLNEQTLVSVEVRKNILRNLLKTKKQIRVQDYIEACRFAIHRRQAERDLLNFFKLKIKGKTRSRVYSR